MKKINNLIYLTLTLAIVAAGYFTWQRKRWYNPPYSPEINAVLFMAGDNRGELEKVLKHYGKNPADSLKLKSAEFLIVNMPGKYSRGYDAPFENVAAAALFMNKTSDTKALKSAFGIENEIVREDVRYITAKYLIDNIEQSFKAWEKRPWGKDVPFDIFCEEILPYRIGSEPLENWREKALACFADLDSQFNQPGTTAVEACTQLNSRLPAFQRHEFNMPSNYSMLTATHKGTCNEIALHAAFVMRAFGIPVTYDFTVRWPYREEGHAWNTVFADSGRHISFSGGDTAPGSPHQGTRLTKGKVLRQMYAHHNHIRSGPENIPPRLNPDFSTDVSMEYDEFTEIEIPERFPNVLPAKHVWLSVACIPRWEPVGWGEMNAGVMKFSASTRNLLYLPVHYSNGAQIPANYPFSLNANGEIHFYEPDTVFKECTVSRIYLDEADGDLKRMQYGRFEGGNKSDFSDAKTLYIIKQIPQGYYYSVKISESRRFRYLRYVSPKEGFCNVAEIKFYDQTGTQLHGTPVGTPGSWQNSPKTTFEKAFDGDVTTYFDSDNNSNPWTGLDLGEQHSLGSIKYLPRNNGGWIYEDHVYELFYWNGKTWQSLGKQKATKNFLEYKIPENTIFYVQNLTTGKNGKIFYVKDGEQKWF